MATATDVTPAEAADGRPASFDDVVLAHAAAFHPELGSRTSESASEKDEIEQRDHERAHLERAKADADRLWQGFKERESVEDWYFSAAGAIGAALSVPPPEQIGSLFIRWRLSRPRIHLKLDLATAGNAAPLVSRYMHVYVRADQRLSGEERQHVVRVVHDGICSLIKIIENSLEEPRSARAEAGIPIASTAEAFTKAMAKAQRDKEAAEQRAKSERDRRVEYALKVAESDVVQAEELCDRAVRRVALISYFVGMMAGIAVFTLLGLVIGFLLSRLDIPGFDSQIFLVAFVSGAVGATVSVMSRMSSGDLRLDYETGRSYLQLVGAFRPLIGAIFGVALYFGLASGLIPAKLPKAQSGELFFFYGFIAFLAGFSERWAQDMLVVGRRGVGRSQPADGAAPDWQALEVNRQHDAKTTAILVRETRTDV